MYSVFAGGRKQSLRYAFCVETVNGTRDYSLHNRIHSWKGFGCNSHSRDWSQESNV